MSQTNYYVVEYRSSATNMYGEMIVVAGNLSHAQENFLSWLKYQPEWLKLTDLTFKFRQVKLCINQHFHKTENDN